MTKMHLIPLIDIGFLKFGIWDVLDIAIVAYLIYRIYKLLRGSIAFSIFSGLLMLYVIWWVVNALHMQLLSTILSQFVSVGVILLIILFQPEIRTFLLDLGRSTFGNRLDPIRKWLNIETKVRGDSGTISNKLMATIGRLRKTGCGGIFVLNHKKFDDLVYTAGLDLNIAYDSSLVESVLLPESNLKNGAIVIEDGSIRAVGARFPFSESENLPEHAELRHRQALGAAEHSDAGVVVLSASDGSISTAYQGYMAFGINDAELERFITAHTQN